MVTELERPIGADIHNDGRICEDPSTNGDVSLPPMYMHGQPESESFRLSTFRGYPERSTALPRRLAQAGFYYTGHGDVVKCFSCGRCVRDMTKDDNPGDRQYHHQDCELTMGGNHGNIPTATPMVLPNFRDLFGPRNMNGHGEDIPPDRPESHRPQQPPQPRQAEPHPPAGAASISPRRRPQPLQNQENVGRRGMDIPPQIERTAFPCDDPTHPEMQNIRDRVMSFAGEGARARWPRERIAATPREIAESGFYFLGEGDRVRCWYCGGGLENWEPNDNPWTEHAKWFPNCEFLLRQKGPDFVHGVSRRFPNLQRPQDQEPVELPAPGPRRNLGNFAATNAIVSGNTITVPPGQTYFHNEPNDRLHNITINSGGMRIQIRRGGNTSIVRTRARRNAGNRLRSGQEQNQPRFVDPRQNAGRHAEIVNEAMASSPLVTSAREMGFTDDIIRVVLLSKCEESSQIHATFEELLENLIQYQEEMARMGINPGPEPPQPNEPSSSGASNQGPESGTPAEQRLRNLEETRTCKLCHRERATVVLMPCAHLAICVTCSERGVRICPVCKRLVSENIRSFIS